MSILSGSSTTDQGTVITVPAGKWWRGSISISSSLAASANVGAQQATPTVTIQGTNSDPVNGSVMAGVSLSTPAVGLLALLGVTSNQTVCQAGVALQAPPGNPVTLRLNTPSSTVTLAVAHGEVSDF